MASRCCHSFTSVTIASAVLCYFLYRKRLSNAPARLLEISGGVALVLTELVVGRDLTIRAEQFLYRVPIVTSVTTPFQHIILTNPLFPASGPATRSFNGLHPKNKFLAI